MAEKNHLFLGPNGVPVQIKIIAASEQAASKTIELIDASFNLVARDNLENQWRHNSKGGDRDA